MSAVQCKEADLQRKGRSVIRVKTLTIEFVSTLHQRKLELLKNVKKSMLDKMFV